jgi:hypothetical protein
MQRRILREVAQGGESLLLLREQRTVGIGEEEHILVPAKSIQPGYPVIHVRCRHARELPVTSYPICANFAST